MDNEKVLIFFRNEMMEKIRYLTGEKREGMIEAMVVLAEIEARVLKEGVLTEDVLKDGMLKEGNGYVE